MKKKIVGGLIATIHLVENYPGITSTSGQGLMEMFKERMNSLKIPYITDEIRSIKTLNINSNNLGLYFPSFNRIYVCDKHLVLLKENS